MTMVVFATLIMTGLHVYSRRHTHLRSNKPINNKSGTSGSINKENASRSFTAAPNKKENASTEPGGNGSSTATPIKKENASSTATPINKDESASVAASTQTINLPRFPGRTASTGTDPPPGPPSPPPPSPSPPGPPSPPEKPEPEKPMQLLLYWDADAKRNISVRSPDTNTYPLVFAKDRGQRSEQAQNGSLNETPDQVQRLYLNMPNYNQLLDKLSASTDVVQKKPPYTYLSTMGNGAKDMYEYASKLIPLPVETQKRELETNTKNIISWVPESWASQNGGGALRKYMIHISLIHLIKLIRIGIYKQTQTYSPIRDGIISVGLAILLEQVLNLPFVTLLLVDTLASSIVILLVQKWLERTKKPSLEEQQMIGLMLLPYFALVWI